MVMPSKPRERDCKFLHLVAVLRISGYGVIDVRMDECLPLHFFALTTLQCIDCFMLGVQEKYLLD